MIDQVARDVSRLLQEQGCPYRVVYGPERFKDVAAVDTRIVLLRDGSTDEVVPTVSQHRNPKAVCIRKIGAKVRVIASSTVAGARREDHERLADQIVDLVIVALRKTLRSWNNDCWFTTGQFLDAATAEMEGLETWPGVVYELSFATNRLVSDVTWQGEARPETADYTFAHGGCVREGSE